MTNVIEIRSKANESESRTALDALCLEGARTMLYQALEVEVAEYLLAEYLKTIAWVRDHASDWKLPTPKHLLSGLLLRLLTRTQLQLEFVLDPSSLDRVQ